MTYLSAIVIIAIIFFSFAGCGQGNSSNPSPQNKPSVQFFLGEYDPMENWQTVINPSNGENVYLPPAPVFNTTDIIGARVSQDELGNPAILVDISQQAANRLQNESSSHIRKPAVIMIDGNVEVVALVLTPLSHTVMITSDRPPAEIQRIVDNLK